MKIIAWECINFSRFNIFGVRRRSPNPSPKNKRRGSAGSSVSKEVTSSHSHDNADEQARFAHHSYSTGNLKELDSKEPSRSNDRCANVYVTT